MKAINLRYSDSAEHQ